MKRDHSQLSFTPKAARSRRGRHAPPWGTGELPQNNKEWRRPRQHAQRGLHSVPPRTPRAARGRRTDSGARETRGAAARPGPSGGRAGSPGRARRLPARAPRRRPEPAPGRGSRGRGRAGPAREKGRGTWRVTWARATARGFRSPAAARPSARRASARSSPPAPRRPGQAARSSAPRRCPRGPGRLRAPGPPRGRAGAGGLPLSRGARLPSPAPAPLGGRGAEERAGRRPPADSGRLRTRAPPLEPLRYRSGGGGDDDQGRVVAANLSGGHWACARGDHIRVISGFGPLLPTLPPSPRCFPFSRCPRPEPPAGGTGGSLCAGARGPAPAAGSSESRPGPGPGRSALPPKIGGAAAPWASLCHKVPKQRRRARRVSGCLVGL